MSEWTPKVGDKVMVGRESYLVTWTHSARRIADLRSIPYGKHVLAGIPFYLLTPAPEPESDGDLLARLGTDAVKWAEEFSRTFGVTQAASDVLVGWFANAIGAGETKHSVALSYLETLAGPDWRDKAQQWFDTTYCAGWRCPDERPHGRDDERTPDPAEVEQLRAALDGLEGENASLQAKCDEAEEAASHATVNADRFASQADSLRARLKMALRDRDIERRLGSEEKRRADELQRRVDAALAMRVGVAAEWTDVFYKQGAILRGES